VAKLPPELDRMYVFIDETSSGVPTRIVLKKVERWNRIIKQVAYTIWVPDEERDYTDKEIAAMREHCRKAGVRFQLDASETPP
jgi:hypothetical protein